jgi:cytosine/adenosine deaminase-related metal-dependent hydrolase
MSVATYRARWLLPIDRSPIEGGWLAVSDGLISDLGAGRPPAGARDLGDVALLPGLVNAHTHLELSWMAGLVPPAATLSGWIQSILRLRRRGAAGGAAAEMASARGAASAMRAAGTALAGDVSNSLTTPTVLRGAGLGGVVFHELLGFAPADPAGIVRDAWDRVGKVEAHLALEGAPTGPPAGPMAPIRFSVVAHAPYSVSPALFSEIARSVREVPLSVHLAESPEEIEFLRSGRGPIREILEMLDVWTDTWPVPACDPVRYLESVGYLKPGVLIVHGVYLTDDALERLRRARAVIVTCPRSNIWVGAGPPRLSHFYAAGVPVAVGTDSLASAPSLSIFDELAEMRRMAPEVAAASLLESATRVGAAALGRGGEYGTIAVGKRAAVIAVDVPAGVSDVEEYLVGGVPATSVRRLTD